MNQVFKYLPLAFTIVQAVITAEAQFQATGTVTAPGIKTYIGTDHVEIDLTLKKI